MPLNFPSSPAVNDQYTFGGRTWIWNGSAWDSYNPGISGYVSALNGFTGGVTLAAGTGITLTNASNIITITNIGVQSFNGLTGAVSGVTQINAGSGISISGSTNPTITNTGVQSFNGLTGAVTGVTTSVANTFTALQTFNSGINASGATFTGPIFLSSGQGLTQAVTSFNGVTGAVSGVTGIIQGTGISVSGSTNVTVTNTGVLSNISGSGISVNSTTGNVTITNTGVTGFNGLTGNVSGVTAVNAGSGISITGTTNPTVTNTGVTGVNGLTGALTVSGGTGMAVLSGGKGITLVNTGVLSVNGSTGAVTNVARTNIDNNFSTSQTISGLNAVLLVEDIVTLNSFTIDPAAFQIGFYNDGSAGNLWLTFPSATDRTVTLPDFNTTLAGLAGTQTFTGSKTFSTVTEFNAGITAAGATFTRPIYLSSGQGLTQAVSTLNGQTGDIGASWNNPGLTSAINYTNSAAATTFLTNQTNYYQSTYSVIDSGGFTTVANRTYFSLFNVPRSTTIKTIRMQSANTVTTGNCHFSVYSANTTTGLPETRLYSSASTAVGSGYNNTTVTNASGLVTVPAGYFYIAVSFSSTPTVYGYQRTYSLPVWGSPDFSNGYRNYYPIADTSGFTAPSAIPSSGVTFGFVGFINVNYSGVRVEFAI